MKIFDKTTTSYMSSWQNKVNFVDKNNVIVGYDLTQDCCEDADWFISTAPITNQIPKEKHKDTYDVEDFNFDPNYRILIKGDWSDYDRSFLDEGGMVIFRLVDSVGNELFLHLYNAHNGYYSHGFTVLGRNLKNNKPLREEGNL